MTAFEHPPLRFVPIAEAHLDQVMAIEQEAYPEPWTRTMFSQEITSDNARFFVAFHEGVLVGYAGFWVVADEAHITSVTVRDTCRGRGFGRCALEFILGEAARLGACIATLEVRASNHRAQDLYLTAGFRHVGVRKGYYAKTGEDALLMAKDLSPAPPASAP
jgi:ribosomal-protein-alanine N-acetyltransferase